MVSSAKVMPVDEKQFGSVDLSTRGNQLPPLQPSTATSPGLIPNAGTVAAPVAAPTIPTGRKELVEMGTAVESEVICNKAMCRYENTPPDETLAGYTCQAIPTALVQGTNELCCGNRMIFGNDQSYFIAAQCLIVIPLACYVYGALVDGQHSAMALPPVLLTVLMELCMWATAAMDPGVVPRDPYPIDVNPDTLLVRDGVQFKWCRTCHIYRPPRTKHCPVCDNCVDRFDHHCPWVGTCIGRRNYRFFFGFILLTCLNAAYTLVCSILVLHHKHQHHDQPVNKAFAESSYLVLSLLISTLAVPLVGSLLFYHVYLVATNKTTNEDLNNVYETEPNPFHLGCRQNFGTVVCGTPRPSRLIPSAAPIQSW